MATIRKSTTKMRIKKTPSKKRKVAVRKKR